VKGKSHQYTLESIKNEVLDATLLTGSGIGIIAYLISLYTWITGKFQITFILYFSVTACFITITFLRKKLSNTIKTYTVIFLLLFLSLMDVIFYGLLSATRIYMVLIPFFCILFLSMRQSVIIYFVTVTSYFATGLLHHMNVLSIPPSYIPAEYINQVYPWVINSVHLLLVGIIILVITRKFIIAYQNVINNQESIIKERTDDLLTANEELQATTEELAGQKEELEGALNMLQETQDQLIESEKMASLGVLAAGVAHEINNPLNFINGGILAISNYISEKVPDHENTVSPLIDDIQTGVRRAADIVSSLNYYSRQDNSTLETCNIHNIIDSCLVMLNHKLKNKAEVIRNYTDKPFTVMAHEGKLHQAFLNILSNAEQAIEKNGIITIDTMLNSDNLEINISDNGCGINESDITRITDPFFTTKEAGKGTGLGLAITKTILQTYNGVLRFTSKPGKGTCATIIFPLT
jgi:signal transduction histidine kinase